ncbi:MAG: ATP-binding cassette domain-containing protein [Bacteroidota bacterium]|nr:ATP-binding cassette domain-containing protein [Bacteroidota bacterium]MDP4230166.1 ATP-binding cassette domain-containing protein [Bacteroidota bacterium]
MPEKKETTTHKTLIEVEHISKSFGSNHVLNDISLTIGEGETLTVLGKSGVGKSVLLKLIVGLMPLDSGIVRYEGRSIAEATEKELNEIRKNIGFLFQGGALFDSMSVGENLNIILHKHTDLPLEERETRIIRALELVGLKDKLDEMPSALSGGQKKRAGLARSIVLKPKLILYDEPTTGLDPITAGSIAELILSLQTELQVASIVVTHDLPTAFTVSDRTIVLESGKKIYDGPVEGLAEAGHDHLGEFLKAAKLDRSRREEIIKNAHKM